MKKFITVQRITFDLYFDDNGSLISIEADYCEEALLKLIKKNFPYGIITLPEIEKKLNGLIHEYNTNKSV
jgi:hypothetical protein